LNLIAVAPLWLLVVLGCAMLAAAIEDGWRFRISNLTVLVVIAAAVAAALIAGPSWRLWQNFAVFAAMLVLGTLAFSGGWLGGGDVKLFAAAGLWFDLNSALPFVVMVLLSGGLLAIGYLVSRLFRRAPERGKKERRVPYGIAIALGAAAMILLSPGTLGRGGKPSPSSKYMPYRG
jgi:prepilin peptidase CpaA